jgi:hypothetical protein
MLLDRGADPYTSYNSGIIKNHKQTRNASTRIVNQYIFRRKIITLMHGLKQQYESYILYDKNIIPVVASYLGCES